MYLLIPLTYLSIIQGKYQFIIASLEELQANKRDEYTELIRSRYQKGLTAGKQKGSDGLLKNRLGQDTMYWTSAEESILTK